MLNGMKITSFIITKETHICLSPSLKLLIMICKSHSANTVLLRKMMKSFIILNILVSVVVVNVGGKVKSPVQSSQSYLSLQRSVKPPPATH